MAVPELIPLTCRVEHIGLRVPVEHDDQQRHTA